MTDSPPTAFPGHHDLLALIKALGNDDVAGARALLDQLSVEELKAVTFYAAETFSLNSPETHPDYVQRTLSRFAVGCVGWFPAYLEQYVAPPERELRKALSSGDPVRIRKAATALGVAIRGYTKAAEVYASGMHTLGGTKGVSDAERR